MKIKILWEENSTNWPFYIHTWMMINQEVSEGYIRYIIIYQLYNNHILTIYIILYYYR